MCRAILLLSLSLVALCLNAAAETNRLCYLDEFCSPYHVGTDFPKLTTPQWMGASECEVVVVLAIDDMRDSTKYEEYLRPILDHLKKVNAGLQPNTAPVSIMTNGADPKDTQIQKWIKEGLNIDVHTLDHPCPCLANGDFDQSKGTYEGCVDLLKKIPGNKPVAFRMPCCDSQNTPSPRFFAEIFNDVSPDGNYLSIDSSVFNVFTEADESIPRSALFDKDGRRRFKKYLPFPSFVNTIENYPYPYVIGRKCWQFPCVVPSDWEAQNLHRPNNPKTVEDMKAALDLTAQKQGVFNLVFHPHGWIRSDQIIEIIDYAVKKYGKRVRFLNFYEADQQLTKNLLAGQSLRDPKGRDNGVRLLDLNRDGYLDVVIGNRAKKMTRVWNAKELEWIDGAFPTEVVTLENERSLQVVRFGAWDDDTVVVRRTRDAKLEFWLSKDGTSWRHASELKNGLPEFDAKQLQLSASDAGLRLRDLNNDGSTELIVANSNFNQVFHWSQDKLRWSAGGSFAAPIVDSAGRDNGVRFIDLDEDRVDEVVQSNLHGSAIYQLDTKTREWIARSKSKRGDRDAIPMISRAGTNNGAWFHSGQLWIQNEDTSRMPDNVDRRSVKSLRQQMQRASLSETSAGAAKAEFTVQSSNPCTAKAIALGEDDDLAILVTANGIGVNQKLFDRVLQRINKSQKVQPNRFVICGTSFSGVDGGKKAVNELANVALRAIQNRRQATLSYAKRRRRDNETFAVETVIQITGTNGKQIATWANCAAPQRDPDRAKSPWITATELSLEKVQPGGIAMLTVGLQMESATTPFPTRLVTSVSQIAKRLMPLHSKIQCQAGFVELPYRQQQTTEARNNKRSSTLRYAIRSWVFGDDLAIVFMQGDVSGDYLARFRKEFRVEQLSFTGFSGHDASFLPSADAIKENSKSALNAMSRLGQRMLTIEAEDLIVDTVQRLLPHQFYSEQKQADFPPPVDAEDALSTFRLRDDLKIELVAAEPLVADPVAFDWDLQGRLWVVEMPGYPNGVDGEGTGGGRVKVLTDDDGDGEYDSAKTFLDDLNFPTGIKVWRDGVLITAAPDIIFAADKDGDLRADSTRILYQGFVEGNQQHRVNGLRWGLDNWLYVANGDSGGTIKSAQTNDEVNISGRDVRIRPNTGEIETVSGQTQFGRNRDDWGNWFGGNNSNPMWHYMLEDGDLRRNPHLRPPSIRRMVSDKPGNAPIFAASKTLSRFNDWHTADCFTSACSPIVYRDNYLGEDYVGNAVVCEPVHNLVHREVMRPDGFSFRSTRSDDEQDSELLASTDNWFRPVMVRTGPDGGLWIADFYRFVIEHPEWIPRDWQRKLDVRAGHDRGRIYRIVRKDKSTTPLPKLALSGFQDSKDKAIDRLIDTLRSPNGTIRDMAHQSLVGLDLQKTDIKRLRQVATSDQSPTARLHALCVLDGLSERQQRPFLDRSTLLASLKDEHPGIRRHGVRLAGKNIDSEIHDQFLKLAIDIDPQVRLQLALSMSNHDASVSARVLGRLLEGGKIDPILRTAILSSLNESNLIPLVLHVAKSNVTDHDAIQELVRCAALMVPKDRAKKLITVVAEDMNDVRAVSAAVHVMQSRNDLEFEQLLSPRVKEALNKAHERAKAIVSDNEANEGSRVAAIRWLGTTPDSLDSLAQLINSQQPPQIQLAAISAIGDKDAKKILPQLIRSWTSSGPQVRAALASTIVDRAELAEEFLAIVAAGEIDSATVSTQQRDMFLSHKSTAVRVAADKLFSRANSDREEVIKRYQAALTKDAVAARGKLVFEKSCSACHRLEEIGHDVGPRLNSLTNRSPHALLRAILAPNQAVEDKYLGYFATTADGKSHSGILRQETSVSVTLDAGSGKTTTIQRRELDELKNTGRSLMPEGLERELSIQQVADVIAYVRSVASPPKQFENNQPTLVRAGNDDSLKLMAGQCSIYGPRLVFEQKYKNLGWWESENDFATWSLVVPRSGLYQVNFDYACAENASGSRVLLQVGGEQLSAKVESTGTWDDYRDWKVGTVELVKGVAELTVRSKGRIRNVLMDLRTVTLTPLD